MFGFFSAGEQVFAGLPPGRPRGVPLEALLDDPLAVASLDDVSTESALDETSATAALESTETHSTIDS